MICSNQNQMTSYPIFVSIFLYRYLHVLVPLSIHIIPHYCLLRQSICLTSVFISKRFVYERLHELIAENLYICSAIALESVSFLGCFSSYWGGSTCGPIVGTLFFLEMTMAEQVLPLKILLSHRRLLQKSLLNSDWFTFILNLGLLVLLCIYFWA